MAALPVIFERSILVLDTRLPRPDKLHFYLWDDALGRPRTFKRRDIADRAKPLEGIGAARALHRYAHWEEVDKSAWLAAISHARRYVSHCWRCETDVDSAVDSRCRRCGWVKCRKCIACGCEWNL